MTFTWADDDRANPAVDVLIRLCGYTDFAFEDGDVGPHLLDPVGDGLWRKEIELPSDLRVSYHICPVRDRPVRGEKLTEERFYEITAMGVPDPSAPRFAVTTIWGCESPSSLWAGPQAEPQPWTARRPGVPAGVLTRHGALTVYTPPGYDDVPGELPLLVLFDGDDWRQLDLAATFDNLIAEGRIPPLVAVLVESIRDTPRMVGLTRSEQLMAFLREDVLPFAEAGWRVTTDPGRTVIAGQSLGGLAALHIGLTAPERFGLVLTQSGSFWRTGSPADELDGERMIAQVARHVPIRVYQEAGLGERFVLDGNRRMRDALQSAGFDLTYREFQGGHDMACWLGGLAHGLITLLGSDR